MAADKGPRAFRTISEASVELGVAPHVLRFWESRFSFIRPITGAGGRRFYRPQDLAVLRGVRALLHGQGCSIKDVQRLHREKGLGSVVEAAQDGPAAERPAETGPLAAPPRARTAQATLRDVLADLERVKGEVDRLLAARPES